MEDDGGVDIDVEECDEDIYGDLETDIFVPPPKKSKAEDIIQAELYQSLVKQNQSLSARNKKLERENKAYATNISALYLTAKNEIEKKNYIIKNLQEKLKRITQEKSSISKEETEEVLKKCQEALQESQTEVTLEEIKKSLKNVSPSTGKRKHIKFGNMSLYFFREQGAFDRQEPVTFPKSSSAVTSTTVDEQPETQTIEKWNSSSPSDNVPPQQNPQSTSTRDNSSALVYKVPGLARNEYDDNKRDRRNRKSFEKEPEEPPHNVCEESNKRRRSSERAQRNTRRRDYSPSSQKLYNRKDNRDVDNKVYKSDHFKERNSRRTENHHHTRATNNFPNSRYSNYNNKRHRSRSR